MIDIAVDLDLFEEQKIEITRRLRDFSDITAKEGEFTRSFQGPASRKNQTALQNYGILGVQSDFNPHKGIPCQWSFSTFVRFIGRLEVTSVVYKDGKPYSFSFNFYGRQRSLANTFAANRFSDIDWPEYDHSLTYNNVVISWLGGLESGELLYPLIDTRANYFFGPSTLNIPSNIRNAENPILLTDLKPAIRLTTFFKEVFSFYNLTLEGDLVDDLSSEFEGLYIQPNKWSGSGVATNSFDENMAAYNALLGDNPLSPAANSEILVDFSQQVQDDNSLFDTTTYTANISGNHTLSLQLQALQALTDAPARYAVRVKKNGTTLLESTIQRSIGDGSIWTKSIPGFEIYLEVGDEVEVFFARITYTVGPLTLAGRPAIVASGRFTIQAPLNQLGQTVSLNDQMPDDKIVDWLNNFAKSYNMLFVPLDDVDRWELISVRNYYARGVIRDWTGFIDIANITLNKPKVYKEISIGYTKTDAAIQTAFQDSAGRGFGSINIRPDVEFGESKLEITNPCTIIPPSLFRVVDAAGFPTGEFADVTIHKSLNVEGNPVKEPWLLFYFNGVQPTNLPYYLQSGFDGPLPSGSIVNLYPHISACQDLEVTDSSVTLCFSLESALNGRVPDNTGYKRYWERELQIQYSTDSRVIVKSKIVLPILQFYNYQLNDEIFLENTYWRIDEITHDQDGKSATVTLSSSRTLLPVITRDVRPGGLITFDRTPDKLDISAAGAYALGSEFYSTFARGQTTPNLSLYGAVINNITQVVINEIEEAGGRFRTWGDEEYNPQS